MLPLLSQDLMRAYRRHGVDGRPLDQNAANLLDLRNAQREARLAAQREAASCPGPVRRPWWKALLPRLKRA